MRLELIENIDSFKNDFKMIANSAAIEAVKRAQKDIKEKADQFIDEYYDEYIPKMHRRHGRILHNLVQEFYEERDSKDKIYFTFGIRYNPENIEGMFKSHSKYHQSGENWVSRFEIPKLNASSSDSGGKFNRKSSDNGIPEPEWITDNFYYGRHPNSVKLVSLKKHKYKYTMRKFKSPNKKMQEFLNKDLKSNIDGYISEYLLKALDNYIMM